MRMRARRGSARAAAPNASSRRIETGFSAACHSGCHCTPRVKPGASATENASTRPSGARASTRRPGARRFTPWPCSELTAITGASSNALEHAARLDDDVVREAVLHLDRIVVARRGGRRSLATWCTAWCSVPPRATLASWKPRQIANSGMPSATTFGISGKVQASRSGSSGSDSSSTVLVEVARDATFDGRAGQQHAVRDVEQVVELLRARRRAR